LSKSHRTSSKSRKSDPARLNSSIYGDLVGGIVGVLNVARRTSARAVNSIMTATYWEIGRRIVEYEQNGNRRAEYGEALLARLSQDLTQRIGRGFGVVNLSQMKKLYLIWPVDRIFQTPSEESPASKDPIRQKPSRATAHANLRTRSATPTLPKIATCFPLPWSAYVRLLAVRNEHARSFYETEALRGGWSVRQLDRQIQSQFYERMAMSRNKTAMLMKGANSRPADAVSPEEEVRDPYVLEFLGRRDESSETELEAALNRHIETFLLELGSDFCFIGRQRRLRINDEWYRVDLLFYHRRLRFGVSESFNTRGPRRCPGSSTTTTSAQSLAHAAARARGHTSCLSS